jgi:type I restriction enzyme S subunit
VYREYGVILKHSRTDNRNPAGKDLASYKVVRRGDLVLNKMKTWQGSLGVSPYDGIVSPAYIVCRLRPDLNPWFIHHLLRSYPYIHEYSRLSYGVRLGQWDMRYEEFKNLPVFIPPRIEQNGIVRVVRRELRHVDPVIAGYRILVGASISAAERANALLHQYRWRFVADVLTGKLDVSEAAAGLPEETEELEVDETSAEENGEPVGETGADSEEAES